MVATICTKVTYSQLPPHHLHKKNFTHSFWLKLMMAAILNSSMLNSDTAILDSDTLLSSLRFTQKHSHSNLTLNQTNSIWLKLIPSHCNLMMAAILNSAILDSTILHKKLTDLILIQLDDWQPSFILLILDHATTILDSAILLSSLRFTEKHSHSNLTLNQTNSIWLKLIPSHVTWWW